MSEDDYNKADGPRYITDIKMTSGQTGAVPPKGMNDVSASSNVQDRSDDISRDNDETLLKTNPAQPESVLSSNDSDQSPNSASLEELDILNEEESTHLPSAGAFVSTGKSKKNKKLMVILLSLVGVMILTVAGYLVWNNFINESSESNSGTNSSVNQGDNNLTGSEQVLAVIDKEYGDNKITPEQFVDKANYPNQYVTYDSDGRYYIRTPQSWHYYDLGQSPQVVVNGGASVCDSTKINDQFGAFLTLAKQSFESASFTISYPKSGQDLKPGIYTQYNNCGSDFVATSTEETCSIYLLEASNVKDSNDLSSRVVGQIACSDMDSVKPEITKLNQANSILESAGSSYKINAQGLDSIEYIKDSQTTGFKIAALFVTASDSTPNYYYQKADSAWQLANQPDQPLSCNTDNADLKAAFKGEKCTVNDTSTGASNESIF